MKVNHYHHHHRHQNPTLFKQRANQTTYQPPYAEYKLAQPIYLPNQQNAISQNQRYSNASPLRPSSYMPVQYNQFPTKLRNLYWENWSGWGARVGYLLVLFGVALSVCEVIRIIYGPTNRGITNYKTNTLKFPAVSAGLLFGIRNEYEFPYRVEKFHYWPWSYAANLFGAVIIAAGVTGIISTYRRSYSSLFAFMTLSLLSLLFSGYLIAYYAVLISYYTSYNLLNANNRPATYDTSLGLIGSNLAFSIASVLLSTAGFIFSFCAIGACSPKMVNYNRVENRKNKK